MIFFIFIFGLIIGSFLNAVIHRLHTGERIISDRSKCVHCGHVLTPLDLVPVVSFIFLGGKCRYCNKKISWQYPIVELAAAVSFVLLALNYGLRITDYGFWFNLVFISVFIIIAVYDFKHYLILDKVILPAAVLAIAWSIVNGQFVNSLLSGAGVSVFFLLQYFVSRGKWIGLGDVKFGFVLGNMFGVLSAVVLPLAYFMGSIAGLALIAVGRKQLSSRLPFGTFLSMSGIITLLYGERILSWYLRLIGF